MTLSHWERLRWRHWYDSRKWEENKIKLNTIETCYFVFSYLFNFNSLLYVFCCNFLFRSDPSSIPALALAAAAEWLHCIVREQKQQEQLIVPLLARVLKTSRESSFEPCHSFRSRFLPNTNSRNGVHEKNRLEPFSLRNAIAKTEWIFLNQQDLNSSPSVGDIEFKQL